MGNVGNAHFNSRAFVISGTPPRMTRYAAGSRYFGTSSATRAEKVGRISEGLIAAGHPAAIAPRRGWNVRTRG